ncbi:MAG: hypothetical protein JWO82_1390 [Akkermansiaceae bacterium]|nr:hypothetical protein [Akkermansiaceae bacterium]
MVAATFQMKPEPQRLRCVTLVRVSTAEQAGDDRAGLDRQREAVERIAASKAYEVLERIELIDVSGTNVPNTPEIRDLMRKMSLKEVDVLLASEMSRIARLDGHTSGELLDCCKRFGVILDLGGTIHDLSSPEGFLSSSFLAGFGGYERLVMLKRMQQSKEVKRARGHNPGSRITLPLGIGYDRKADLYTYTDSVTNVIEAFRLMDEEGIRNLSEIGRRSGINLINVRHILRNPIYKGWRVYDKCRDQTQKRSSVNGRQGDRPKIKREPEKVIKVRVFPPDQQAVTDERWERVQAVLKGIRENHAVYVAEHHKGSLLAGTGRCGFCGERLYAKTRSRRLADGTKVEGHYLCRSHHESATRQAGNFRCAQPWSRKEALDELAEAFVLRFLADAEFVRTVLDQARNKQASKVVGFDLGDTLQKKLDDLDRKDRRVLDGLEEGIMSNAEAKQRRERLAEEKARVLASIRAHERTEADEVQLTGIASRIAKATEGWPAEGSNRDRKHFLQQIFAEVYFRGATITAFRLAPGLVGEWDGVWRFASELPVSLDPPLHLTPPPIVVEVPEGHKQCSQCREVKLLDLFYKGRAACKVCVDRKNSEYRLRSKASPEDG